jgi:hypothetical protein
MVRGQFGVRGRVHAPTPAEAPCLVERRHSAHARWMYSFHTVLLISAVNLYSNSRFHSTPATPSSKTADMSKNLFTDQHPALKSVPTPFGSPFAF